MGKTSKKKGSDRLTDRKPRLPPDRCDPLPPPKDSSIEPPSESWAEKLRSSDSNRKSNLTTNTFDVLNEDDDADVSPPSSRPPSSSSDDPISKELQSSTTAFHARMDNDINDIREDNMISGPQYVTLDQFNRLMRLMRQMSEQLESTTKTDSHNQVNSTTSSTSNQSHLHGQSKVSVLLPKAEPTPSVPPIKVSSVPSLSLNDTSHHSSATFHKHDSCQSSSLYPHDPRRQLNQESASYHDSNKPTNTNSSSVFNQTIFGIAVSGKVKLPQIQNHLKDTTLENDSVLEMERLYSSIMMGISFGFETSLDFILPFESLDRTINFDSLFLDGLHGQPLLKARHVYLRIGEIIKNRLTSSTCISSKRSPKAGLVIRTNIHLNGWKLLETLLLSRLVRCGAVPDLDLDSIRANITFQKGESYQDFYIRNKDLLTQYTFSYSDDNVIPRTKITKRFVEELNRAQEYVHHLSSFHREIIQHIKMYGDMDTTHYLSFGLEDIYLHLFEIGAPSIPKSLSPSKIQQPIASSVRFYDQQLKDTSKPSVIASAETKLDFLDSLDHTMISPSDTCIHPTICAYTTVRNRCQACLIGLHKENDCYLRGPDFRPKELNQRINVYNQVHGTKPPPGHKMREYRPRGKDAVHPTSESSSNNQPSSKLPFANYHTKTRKEAKPTINSLENDDIAVDDCPTTHDAPDNPTISAFIQDQVNLDLLHQDEDDTDDLEMRICVFTVNDEFDRLTSPTITSFAKPSTITPQLTHHCPTFLLTNVEHNDPNAQVCQHTPLALYQSIIKQHQSKRMRPSKTFLRQHSQAINRLPPLQFQKFGNLTFHVDGGANCGAVRDKRAFYFFIPSPSEITDVGGKTMHSPGWGGILIRINDVIQLMAPVYLCPGNPRNTLSTTSLIQFTGCHSAVVNTNKWLDIVPSTGESIRLPFMVYNDLDHVEFEIVQMRNNMDHAPFCNVIASAQSQDSRPLRRSPRLMIKSSPPTSSSSASSTTTAVTKSPSSNHLVEHAQSRSPTPSPLPPSSISPPDSPNDIPPDTSPIHTVVSTPLSSSIPVFDIWLHGSYIASIDKPTMSIIAEYFVNLHQAISPRHAAIASMNHILGNTFNTVFDSRLSIVKQSFDSQAQREEHIVPVIANLSRSTTSSPNGLLEWQKMHLGMMHSSPSTMDIMIQKKLLLDIPSVVSSLRKHDKTCTCSVCILSKATKLPRGKVTDKSKMQPFERIHVDFSFFGCESIRGFTTALDITCASTGYTLGFPTRSKSPPLEILIWVVNTLRNMGHIVSFIRVDEDGSLSRSTEFKLVVMKQLRCLLETTGPGDSTNNGAVEVGNRTKANMVRSGLATMELLFGHDLPNDLSIEKFWCFTYQMACFTLRRTYNRRVGDIPYFLVHGRRPSLKENIIPGSIMTIVDPNKNLLKKLDPSRARRGHFLCYSQHIRTRLYWEKSSPYKIKRSTHCIIEDIATMDRLRSTFTSSQTSEIQSNVLNVPDEVKDACEKGNKFDISDEQFPGKNIIHLELKLPPFPTTIGLKLDDDLHFNLPVLSGCVHDSFAHYHVPPGRRKNYFIVGLNEESPLTAKGVKDYLQRLQKSNDRLVTLDLVHRGKATLSTQEEVTRAMFDQLPSLLQSRPAIAALNHDTNDEYTHFISAPSKPPTPKTIFDALKSPYRLNYRAAAWRQFMKNHNIAVFSIPFPKTDLPQGSNVFRSQLVPEVKNTDVPGIFELKMRHVIVGTPQKWKVDFDSSYAPTIDPVTARIQIALSAARGYQLAVVDIGNAFQNTIAKPKDRMYVTTPIWYLEWMEKEFKMTFDKNEKYLLQMFNSNQGTKDAGNLWYNLLKPILEQYGLIRSTVDHAYFVKTVGDQYLSVSLATDDFLVSSPTHGIFEDFKLYLNKYFLLTAQTGQVLKFLGLRIIQSSSGITIDQGEYVFEMLKHYFGEDIDKIKTVSTPMRYDSEFERELFDAIPLCGEELRKAEIKYKGSYRFWTGKFMFLNTQTRPEVGIASQRLAEYNDRPTQVAFESIGRFMRYLAGDPLRPITYPCSNLDGYSSVSWYATPDNKIEIKVPHYPTMFADAELGRCLATRRTYYCVVITVFNVYILMKIKKTSSVMVHTTDGEMRASYAGVRHLIPIRKLFAFSGVPLDKPSTAFTDNAAVDAIIDTERMTPRCRHLDIPIAFLHQEKGITYHLLLCRTMVMLADMGTKLHTPRVHKLFKYWATGEQHLQNLNDEHKKLLQMEYYEVDYASILKLLKGKT